MTQETPIIQEFKQSRVPAGAEAPASVAGPGARLRLARLEMNVSIEDIAAHLRLSPQVILDIEQDEYTNTLFTFTRGYLRGYAKLIGLPEEEIIQSFNELHLTESPRPYLPLEDASRKPLKVKDGYSRHHQKAMRWISASVILLLLVLVGFWWENQSTAITPLQHNGTHSSKLVPMLSSASQAPSIPENPTNLVQNNVTQGGTSDAQTSVGTTEGPSTSDAVPPPDAANAQVAASTEPATTQTHTAVDATSTGTIQANPVVSTTVPAAQTPVAEATTPSTQATDSKAEAANTQTQSAPAKMRHHAAKKSKPASSSQPINTIVPVPYSANG